MTDGLDQLMADAGLNLLRADVGLVVLDEPVPQGLEPPYVRVYTHIEWLADDPANSLDALTSRAVVRWYCHCVGSTDMASRAVAQRVRTQLLDQRPTITGRQPGLIRHEQSQPPTANEEAGPAVISTVQVYRLMVD